MRLSAALVAVLLITPTLAGEGGKKADAPKEPPKSPTNVDMPILVAPMVVDGKLTGYAYLNPAIDAASEAMKAKVLDKVPFLQDAFIRDLNGQTIVDPTDPAKFDTEGVTARLLADARRIMGSSAVKGLSFNKVEIARLVPQAALAAPAAPVQAAPPPPAPKPAGH